MNHMFKVNIIYIDGSSRYLKVELKASIRSYCFSFVRDFMKSLS